MGGRLTMAVSSPRFLVWTVGLGLLAAGVLGVGSRLALGSSLRAAAGRFSPRSVTFVSVATGWVLGTAPCVSAAACLVLRETTDGGRSWFSRPLPASLVAAADRKVGGVPAELVEAPGVGLSVRFADLRDGWIYGAVPTRQAGIAPTLWSTHDGGLVWRKQPLGGLGRQGSIFDVEAAAGTVHLMESNSTAGVTVKSSPVAADNWHVSNTVRLGNPAGGAEQSGAFVLQRSGGWLVEGNDRGTTGSAQLDRKHRWVSWTPPCAAVGHSFAIPAASTARDLVAVCVMGGFASPLSRAAPRGATLGSSWLYVSNDGGTTFHARAELGRSARVFFGGVLASPAPGVILIGHVAENGQQDLIASFDKGAHWTVVHRGQPLFLGFTSPTQGVGIIRSSGSTTTMIMTFDGGHHWASTTF
jgi:hypothetical protein